MTEASINDQAVDNWLRAELYKAIPAGCVANAVVMQYLNVAIKTGSPKLISIKAIVNDHTINVTQKADIKAVDDIHAEAAINELISNVVSQAKPA